MFFWSETKWKKEFINSWFYQLGVSGERYFYF
jgi:hypothetical protein